MVVSHRTGGKGHKNKTQKIPYEHKKNRFFTVRVIKYWNRFPRKFMDSSAVKTLKPQMDFKVVFESKETHKRIVLT